MHFSFGFVGFARLVRSDAAGNGYFRFFATRSRHDAEDYDGGLVVEYALFGQRKNSSQFRGKADVGSDKVIAGCGCSRDPNKRLAGLSSLEVALSCRQLRSLIHHLKPSSHQDLFG